MQNLVIAIMKKICLIESVYNEEKENLEFADEIGDFGWLKYYSSEYKRGYRLSRKVYIK